MVKQEPCSDPLCVVNGIGETIGGAVNFWQDPFGNTFQALKDAASGLAEDVLPALTEATLPDLTAEWFLSAYAIAFAAGIFFAVVLLIPQILRTARGTMAGRDLLESIGLYFPLFIVGAMFGPMLGVLLVNFFHALAKVFIDWGVSGNYAEVIDQMQAMIDEADPAAMTGGVFVACILMLCMVIGLFLVVLMLIVQLVTLYFTGVLVPFGLAWIIDPTHRTFGIRIVFVWLGILAAHPALFFLLGFAYNIMGNTIVTLGENDPLQTLVTFIVALLALFMAALSPLLLLKFAPIIPTGLGSTSGPSLGGTPIGVPSMTDAGDRYGASAAPASDPGTSSTSTASTVTEESSSQPASGGLSDVAAARAAETPAAAPGAAGAAAGVGEASAIGSAGVAGAASAEGLAAAGAAESATGAGAAIGVPTLIAAGALKATETAREIGNAAVDQAVAPMDEQSTIGEDRL